MPSKEKHERRLLYRYDRYDDGTIQCTRPYSKQFRDDLEMNKYDCLAFEEDLSRLPERTKNLLLLFELAYVCFYRTWTRSGDLPKDISRALDFLQGDFENLRSTLRRVSEGSPELEMPDGEYPLEKVQEAAKEMGRAIPE